MSFLNELSWDARFGLNFKLTDCTLLNANEIQKNMGAFTLVFIMEILLRYLKIIVISLLGYYY